MVLAAALREELIIPDGVEVILDEGVTVKGPQGDY